MISKGELLHRVSHAAAQMGMGEFATGAYIRWAMSVHNDPLSMDIQRYRYMDEGAKRGFIWAYGKTTDLIGQNPGEVEYALPIRCIISIPK